MFLVPNKYSFLYFKLDVKNYIKNWKYRKMMRFCKCKRKNVLFFYFEPSIKHAGLADRIKAVISLYNIAKLNNYEFCFSWTTPFDIETYLSVKKNVLFKKEELEYSIFDTEIISEVNWRDNTYLKPNKQYHCYIYSGNAMPYVFENTGLKWNDLFTELFLPQKVITDYIESLNIKRHTFVSVHFRFVNALEHFENTFFDNYIESELEKQNLIKKCHRAIRDIIAENLEKQVFVFSDSSVFLNSLMSLPVKVLEHDNLAHVSERSDKDSILKSFVDLYVMSMSSAVYRIRAKELYNFSEYSLLAARIGDVPFINKDI